MQSHKNHIESLVIVTNKLNNFLDNYIDKHGETEFGKFMIENIMDLQKNINALSNICDYMEEEIADLVDENESLAEKISSSH